MDTTTLTHMQPEVALWYNPKHIDGAVSRDLL